MGLYTMSVSRKNACAVRCLQMHCFESTTSYLCISCSFPNHLTNVIIYPKTRICFVRLGYTLLEFIIVIIIILMDGILLVFIHATPPTCVCKLMLQFRPAMARQNSITALSASALRPVLCYNIYSIRTHYT